MQIREYLGFAKCVLRTLPFELSCDIAISEVITLNLIGPKNCK